MGGVQKATFLNASLSNFEEPSPKSLTNEMLNHPQARHCPANYLGPVVVSAMRDFSEFV
jgi:hypothetical protein